MDNFDFYIHLSFFTTNIRELGLRFMSQQIFNLFAHILQFLMLISNLNLIFLQFFIDSFQVDIILLFFHQGGFLLLSQ